eukprot:TRINITY_DN2298_c0_g1_i2.p1 TRINITY_DN2298_c0_g1~~TRINITY_DN2298_c0_g1_i2.p1  ORF type:complete len:392 (-),score=84.41 TRINITY_DN2298_c0_g1_i2:1101-2237(-)
MEEGAAKQEERPRARVRAAAVSFFVFFQVCRHWPLLLVAAAVAGALAGSLGYDVGGPVDGRDAGAQAWDPAAVFWFVHISDVHMNVKDSAPQEALDRFLGEVLPVVSPSFVLCTGDLVTAAPGAHRQVKKEWESYRAVLQNHNMFNASFWFDMRGNHDTYAVNSEDDPHNYARDYMVTGKAGAPLTSFVWNTSFGTYRMLAIHFEMQPSPTTTFFGVATNSRVDAFKQQTEDPDREYNHTFLVGHWPLTYITDFTLRPFMGTIVKKPFGFTAYLCGHLHMPATYARQHAGYVELEVQDFTKSRAFRVLAVDNDLYSFSDARTTFHGGWNWDEGPLIVPTVPKPANLLSEYEPLQLMRHSPVMILPSRSTATRCATCKL